MAGTAGRLETVAADSRGPKGLNPVAGRPKVSAAGSGGPGRGRRMTWYVGTVVIKVTLKGSTGRRRRPTLLPSMDRQKTGSPEAIGLQSPSRPHKQDLETGQKGINPAVGTVRAEKLTSPWIVPTIQGISMPFAVDTFCSENLISLELATQLGATQLGVTQLGATQLAAWATQLEGTSRVWEELL
jgi:hypothetical protein